MGHQIARLMCHQRRPVATDDARSQLQRHHRRPGANAVQRPLDRTRTDRAGVSLGGAQHAPVAAPPNAHLRLVDIQPLQFVRQHRPLGGGEQLMRFPFVALEVVRFRCALRQVPQAGLQGTENPDQMVVAAAFMSCCKPDASPHDPRPRAFLPYLNVLRPDHHSASARFTSSSIALFPVDVTSKSISAYCPACHVPWKLRNR